MKSSPASYEKLNDGCFLCTALLFFDLVRTQIIVNVFVSKVLNILSKTKSRCLEIARAGKTLRGPSRDIY